MKNADFEAFLRREYGLPVGKTGNSNSAENGKTAKGDFPKSRQPVGIAGNGKIEEIPFSDLPEAALPSVPDADISGLGLPKDWKPGKHPLPDYDSKGRKPDGLEAHEPGRAEGRRRLDGLEAHGAAGKMKRDRSRLPLPPQFPFPFDLAKAERAEAEGRLAEYEAECEAACPGVGEWCSRYPACGDCRWNMPAKLFFCRAWNCLRYDAEEADLEPRPEGGAEIVIRNWRQGPDIRGGRAMRS